MRYDRRELQRLVSLRYGKFEGQGENAFIDLRIKVTPELLEQMIGGYWTAPDGKVSVLDAVDIDADGYAHPAVPRAGVGMTAFLMRHSTLHLFVHRLAHAFVPKDQACLVCAAVWRYMDEQPGFRAGVIAGQEDMNAGRWYRYDVETGWVIPNPDWPKDGIQPKPPYRLEPPL